MIKANKINITRTAHFYTIGEPSRAIQRFWIVCHGYGQLARTFIRRFDVLNDGKTLVLAPEGLSKFYWGGFTGEPVASWMTREHRLDEIADYCNYLQTIYDYFLPKLAENVDITLMGFSQGTATHCRWILQNFPRFDHLVLWAGLLPDDLDFRPHQAYFSAKSLHFVYGLKDPFLTDARLSWQREFAEANLLDFQEFTFKGEHQVERAALAEFSKQIMG